MRRGFFDASARQFRAGRHAGEDLADVPDGYLRWVLESVSDLDPLSRSILQTEMYFRGLRAEDERRYQERYRRQERPHNFATATRLEPDQVPVALELIAAGRRALAARNHPDIGGDPERMKAINVVADDLETGLRALAGRAA